MDSVYTNESTDGGTRPRRVSWSDEPEQMQNSSATESATCGCGANYTSRRKLQRLMNTIRILKVENHCLKYKVRLYYNKSQEEEKNVDFLGQEAQLLRERLENLQNLNKTILENHATFVQKFKDKIESTVRKLSDRLTSALEISSNVEDRLESIKESLHLSAQNKIEAKETDQMLKSTVLELEDEKRKYLEEKRVWKNQLSEKEHQVGRLKMQLTKECTRIKQEVLKIKNEVEASIQGPEVQIRLKLETLKKKIRSLQNKNEKLSLKYERHLSCILKDFNLKMRAVRQELERKEEGELEAALETLETKYKNLLAEIDIKHRTQRINDLKRIRDLEEMVMNI